ncbi:3-deoxy-7-phosphoheptulonate synthase [Motilimonas pumila]|uniref:Phospho-2-dehydro-3-deoxyheptonate aldolase n=1 Tax=Motilimonas pumila TaxID=2303987 RepID=A0A418YF22_9GAMM|nr:3-deoxy-7-phosphoheptulonate synthase [Motilimonas pumila]RJG47780.1 3-deoxy-7-phosphoheptulonate synthase [Motilimonas pumila]
MPLKTDELRTEKLDYLITPAELAEHRPLTDAAAGVVTRARRETEAILSGEDKRLLVIVGPCSIHDPEAGLAYAKRLVKLKDELSDDLCIVMRTYFEKPRTVVGWKGLINDPDLDGSNNVNKGITLARNLLLDINELGLATATEFLDMVTGQYVADLITWGAIGARTTESQIHREMASALSCPVGFKNGTDGNLQIALDAVRAAKARHIFYSPDKIGRMTIYKTAGNPYGHIILRGGKSPNYSAKHIAQAEQQLSDVGLTPRLVVDFSHGNSLKQYKKQLDVANDIMAQMRAGSKSIAGVMIESFIEEGNQAVEDGKELVFGKSITDACINWQDTELLLRDLAKASRESR